MPTDEKDNLELYETREHELLEELGRCKFDDVKRSSIVKELDTIAKIRSNYESNEQTRLNNNRRNDIEEDKLKVEEAKLANDKLRTKVTVGQTIMFLIASIGAGVMSYNMDETKQAYKKVQKVGDDLINLIRRT